MLYGKINSEKQLEQCEQSYLPPTQIGILKVMRVQEAVRPSLQNLGCWSTLCEVFRFDGSRLTCCSFLHCQTLDEMKLEIKPIKIDRRLTGSSFIDEPLQQVCLYLYFFHQSHRQDQEGDNSCCSVISNASLLVTDVQILPSSLQHSEI